MSFVVSNRREILLGRTDTSIPTSSRIDIILRLFTVICQSSSSVASIFLGLEAARDFGKLKDLELEYVPVFPLELPAILEEGAHEAVYFLESLLHQKRICPRVIESLLLHL
jgi:hypothetical protein